MSKRQFKSQASSSRVSAGGFGGFGGFGSTTGSSLSYLSEPPNLTAISDANVVVAFKNLLKKDSTTKTKGLEDLINYVSAHPFEQDGGVEQSILEAWVKLYPRMSIDNSRRARELAHNLQYELLKSARKRMEKFIPSVVGAWLAGTYDRDRSVARAANDGITSFLDTEEKVLSFWKRCQVQILAYAQEAIEETPRTLSDERTVNADDMKAKHDRVIGSSLSLVVNMLAKLPADDIQKQQSSYDTFLSDSKALWKFTSSDDSFVRRTTYQLLQVSIQKQESIIAHDLQLVSSALISEGLRTTQSSSAVPFLHALILLTSKFPEAWTSSYKGKKSPLSRLCHFIERGSQAGPPDFWQLWTVLVKKLPVGILPTETDEALKLLKAQRTGICNREESRLNITAAWKSYLDIVKIIATGLQNPVSVQGFLELGVYPAFSQYMHPSAETSQWTIGSHVTILADLFSVCVGLGDHRSLQTEWQRIADILVQEILISQPEKSKDYVRSQTAVIADANKWFTLQAEIVKSNRSQSVLRILSTVSGIIIEKAMETLINRNGKPFGAAGVLESALRLSPGIVTASEPTLNKLKEFLEGEVPKLAISPSAVPLVKTLNIFQKLSGQDAYYASIWHNIMDGLGAVAPSEQKLTSVEALLANDAAGPLAKENSDLQDLILLATAAAVQGDQSAYSLLITAVTNKCLSQSSFVTVVNSIIESLDGTSTQSDIAFNALETIVVKQPSLMGDNMLHITLMTKLLAIGGSSDDNQVSRAASLRSKLESSPSDTHTPVNSIVKIIQDNLSDANIQSLSIDTLVQHALHALNSGLNHSPSELLPQTETWSNQSLHHLLAFTPNPATALTNTLGGAVFLIRGSNSKLGKPPSRDADGFSAPFRQAIYTSRVIANSDALDTLSLDEQVGLLRLLCITVELASDQLGLQEANLLWADLRTPDVEMKVQEFLSTTQKLLNSKFDDVPHWRNYKNTPSVAGKLIESLLQGSKADSPTAFYQGRALCSLFAHTLEVNGWQTAGSEDWLTSLDLLKVSTMNVVAASALLHGLKESLGPSKIVNGLCNRLVSDIAGVSLTSEKALRMLVYLNAVLEVYEVGQLPIPQTRLVFAVRHLTSWMQEQPSMGPELATESLKCLQFLLPCISGVYGSHWEISIQFCLSSISKSPIGEQLDAYLPLYHASMKTVALVHKLWKDADSNEKNDDIEDTIKQTATELPESLLKLLRLPRAAENQPWTIVDDLLDRQLETTAIAELQDLEDVYPLLESKSRVVQSTAFKLLQRYALMKTESINYDTILEKQDASLPAALLSLLLECPVYEKFDEEDLVQFPSSVRRYLFAWHIIFDHFVYASYKLRNDYNKEVKSGDYLTPLLDFLFEVLGHSIARAIDLDRAGLTVSHIRAYDCKTAMAEEREHDMQWLLVNLYYKCLKYMPSMAKNWWIDCKSKQTRLAVEAWTERHFSPLNIEDTLDEVAKWTEEQEEPAEDEKELLVKVSRKSKEVYAGYEVDDMQAQIVIRLPPTYPLEGVKVESVHRVAVSEKKWQSWLMITQGVITFSNGSITDGLSIFRKNVMGALKGQTECAICYSIVSSDRKMPDKRCQTCKNLFHSSCLFKWFASSNQSTCPLCRNPFTYGDSGRRRTGRD